MAATATTADPKEERGDDRAIHQGRHQPVADGRQLHLPLRGWLLPRTPVRRGVEPPASGPTMQAPARRRRARVVEFLAEWRGSLGLLRRYSIASPTPRPLTDPLPAADAACGRRPVRGKLDEVGVDGLFRLDWLHRMNATWSIRPAQAAPSRLHPQTQSLPHTARRWQRLGLKPARWGAYADPAPGGCESIRSPKPPGNPAARAAQAAVARRLAHVRAQKGAQTAGLRTPMDAERRGAPASPLEWLGGHGPRRLRESENDLRKLRKNIPPGIKPALILPGLCMG